MLTLEFDLLEGLLLVLHFSHRAKGPVDVSLSRTIGHLPRSHAFVPLLRGSIFEVEIISFTSFGDPRETESVASKEHLSKT